MKIKTLHYTIVLRPEPEGGFTVTVPALTGCVTYGRDLREAREMAEDAIGAYVASLKKRREPIPSDEKSFIASIDFTLPIGYAAKAS